eukprot:457958-Alexandrium_andersonii.AAC.1
MVGGLFTRALRCSPAPAVGCRAHSGGRLPPASPRADPPGCAALTGEAHYLPFSGALRPQP